MHDTEIPQWVIDRVINKRGAEHVFTDLDPARTALIVIDMQNAFIMPGVGFAEIRTAPEIVPNINRLADAMRAAGGTVVWIKMTYSDDEPVEWSAFYGLCTPELGAKRREALTKGSEGHRIWAKLDVLAGDREDEVLGPGPGVEWARRVPEGARDRHPGHHRVSDRRVL